MSLSNDTPSTKDSPRTGDQNLSLEEINELQIDYGGVIVEVETDGEDKKEEGKEIN